MTGKEHGMPPLISVVIPAYNAERYLDECVRSIVEQDYSNLQVLLVDDGSSDSTPELCDEWSCRDKRVSSIHTANRGPSAARNRGLIEASGDWIWFVDADDYVAPGALEKIAERISACHCELVAIGIKSFNEEGELPVSDLYAEATLPEGVIKSSELESLLYQGRRGHYLYSYLFKADCLRAFAAASGPFDEDMWLFEDAAFLHQYLGNVSDVCWIDDRLYWYRQTEGSLLHRADAKKAASGLKAVEQIREIEVNPDLRGLRQQMVIRFLLSIDTLAGDSVEGIGVRRRVRELLADVLAEEPRGNLPLALRAKCLLVRMGIYQTLRKLLIKAGVIRAWDEA